MNSWYSSQSCYHFCQALFQQALKAPHRHRVMSAARKMSSKSLPKSIRISDIADELEALYTGLMMPAGG